MTLPLYSKQLSDLRDRNTHALVEASLLSLFLFGDDNLEFKIHSVLGSAPEMVEEISLFSNDLFK